MKKNKQIKTAHFEKGNYIDDLEQFLKTITSKGATIDVQRQSIYTNGLQSFTAKVIFDPRNVKSNELNIYEFKESESTWVAAKTIIEAIEIHELTTGISIDEMDNEDDIILVPRSEWAKLKVTSEGKEISFEEHMKLHPQADIIASTAW